MNKKKSTGKIACCPRCGLPLELETVPDLKRRYKYVCRFCDENFAEIEAVWRKASEVPKLTKDEKILHTKVSEMVNYIINLNGHMQLVGDDYIRPIAEKIVRDVMSDLVAAADHDDWNDDDLRMAIGRVLCKKLHIQL